MTDLLMQHGRHGAEVLAGVIRAAFEPMMRAVYEQGGFVFSQEGDAFSALFLAEPEDQEGALRALSAALRIQQEINTYSRQRTEYGEFAVQVRLGLSCGDISWAIVSSPDGSRAAYYFHGAPVDASAEAQKRAQANGIAFDSAFLSALRSTHAQVQTEPTDGFFSLRQADFVLLAPMVPELPGMDLDVAARFYPTALLTTAVPDEFRPVVNLFISLPTIRTEAQLAMFMQSLFALQERYGGLLSRLGFGDKGPHLLLFWGAPAAHENDIQRALHFILELQTQTAIPITCGVTYRIAHIGLIGGANAKDYAPFGRGTNLAARFMSSASRGEIWVDEYVAARAGSRFDLEPGGEIQFKGFSSPQKIFILGERKEEEPVASPGAWVGRAVELDGMAEFTRQVFTARSSAALILWGEPGIGKSGLAREFIQRQQQADPETIWFVAQCDEILRKPLNPFRYWLRRYLQVSEAQVEARNKRSFNRAVDQLIATTSDPRLADELDRTRSFLGALVDLQWPDSLYEQLDAKGRYENTFLALAALLQAESQRHPVIFLLEDAHWLDDDSRDFLPRLLRAIHGRILFCITSRSAGVHFNLSEFSLREFHLDRLNREDLAGLARSALAGEVSPDLLDLLDGRAEGNPFFAEQILAYLGEEGLLVKGPSGWSLRERREIDLPTDVGSLLLARIDRLIPDVREVVQTASVLGREFESRILAAMRPGEPRLTERIGRATEENIWHTFDELRYIFQHGLLRDAAYQMQIRKRRRTLHRLAYEAMIEIYGPDSRDHYGDYVFHASQAGMHAEALRYSVLAGQCALDAYQNRLADEYFSAALQSNPDLQREQRFELLLGRETALDRSGQLERRARDLAELESLANELQDGEKWAEVQLRKANYAFLTGAYAEAEQAALGVISQAGIEISIKAYQQLALVDLRTGFLDRSIARAESGISLAEAVSDRRGVRLLLNSVGLARMEQGNLESARAAFEQALAVAEETGSVYDQAAPLSNLGMLAGVMGNFPESLAYYERGLALARKSGDRTNEGLVLGNMGWIAGSLGAYEQAIDYCEQFLRISREVGNANGESYSLINLSAYAVAQGHFTAAREYAGQALERTRKSGDRAGEAWSLTYLGHCALGMGAPHNAVEWYQQALAIRGDLKQSILAAEPLGGLARAALEEGRMADAVEITQWILPQLEAGDLDGTEEPVRVYLNAYVVLSRARDARAAGLLEKGVAFLQARAELIREAEARQIFLYNIPSHRELLEAWERRQGFTLSSRPGDPPG